jgi:branched-chain amino acid aminotransferase
MWQARTIMMNGELMPFEQASIHPLSLAVTYACTVFEGLRAYKLESPGQFALFRLREHLDRLRFGMKVMRMAPAFDPAYLQDCLTRLIRANDPDDDVYIRLLVYIEGQGLMATSGPIGFTAAAMPRERPKFAEILVAAVRQRKPAPGQGHGQLSQCPSDPDASQG